MVPNQPISQIFRRLTETILSENNKYDECMIDDVGCAYIKSVRGSFIHNDIYFSTKSPDNAVLVGNTPCMITEMEEKIRVQKYAGYSNYFESFIPSSHLGIYRCVNLRKECSWSSKEDIRCKGLMIPSNECSIFYLIGHTWKVG